MKKQKLDSSRTRILTEAVVFVALSIVLKDVLPPLYHMPQGGSVTIAGMVPLIWFALRRGLKYGLLAGFMYGLIHAILPGSYIINPVQGLLDYPLAFAALGLAGAFKKIPIMGVMTSFAGRFLSSFAAGLFFFTENPFSIEGVYVSAVYNGTYLIPEYAITVTVLYLLLERKLLNIYM